MGKIINRVLNIANEMVPLRAVKTFKRMTVGQTDLFQINQSSSVTLNKLAMKARKSYYNFKFKQRSHTMTDIKPNEVQII